MLSDNGSEEIIKDRIQNKSGKDFQNLFWDILICHHADLQTPRMQHDLGNDGYSIDGKVFFAVYSPESLKYDNDETSKKISNSDINKLGDYEKFIKNWKDKYPFTKWVFVTRDDLMGKPHQKIVELNNIKDDIKKEHWGLQQIIKLAVDLNDDDKKRIFNLPNTEILNNSTEVETIIDLIEYISSNSELNADDLNNVMADPDKKIYERFVVYCKEIENEITECAMYAKAQKEAEKVVGLDKIKVGKITAFLKRLSRKILRENNNNPMDSLDRLTNYFEDILKKSNKNYDQNAIRYYLIGEIPKCNVFPND